MSIKYEMRGAWISTVLNIDLRPGMNEKEFTEWAQSTIRTLERKNFNTVIFQVKPTADALYPSKLAPWSKYLTGKEQGTDPGYDPLKIMVDVAHRHGLELHAWINPYRVTMPNQTLDELASNNIAKQHPEWVVQHGKQYYLDPGIPGVQDYLVSAVQELVENYDVDAVHMDDYFYPGVDFQDEATFKQYGNDFSEIGDWRRHNVSQLVKKINQTVKAVKPWVQFGISPSGIWRNEKEDPAGSATNGGGHYDRLFADSREWIREGSIDYITPQIYWSRQFEIANYSVLLDWWSQLVETEARVHPVHLYIGMADYRVNSKHADTAWENPREIAEQIMANREKGVSKGQMHFTLNSIFANKLHYSSIIDEEVYHTKALTPALPWNGAESPEKPLEIRVQRSAGQNEIHIRTESNANVRKYAIYRFEQGEEPDFADAKKIIGVVYCNGQEETIFTDKDSSDRSYAYGVTAISLTGVESEGRLE